MERGLGKPHLHGAYYEKKRVAHIPDKLMWMDGGTDGGVAIGWTTAKTTEHKLSWLPQLPISWRDVERWIRWHSWDQSMALDILI